MSHPSCCCFQYQQHQKTSLLRAIGNMKAAKTNRSPEKCSRTPRLLKRYLGRGGIKVLSKMNGKKKTIWRFYFFISGNYDPRNTSHRRERRKIKLNRRTPLLFLVMQMHSTIHLKETKSIFSSPPKCQHLQMSYRSHFWKAKYSPRFISSVTPQIVTKNR